MSARKDAGMERRTSKQVGRGSPPANVVRIVCPASAGRSLVLGVTVAGTSRQVANVYVVPGVYRPKHLEG